MIIPTNIQNALSNGFVDTRFCFWAEPRNRETGIIEAGGIHSGLDDLIIPVTGQSRTYRGAGQILSVSPLSFEVGTNIQTQTIELSALAPDVIHMVRALDIQYVPCDIQIAFLNPNGTLLGAVQAFKGFVDKIDIHETAEDAKISVEIVSSIRVGTKPSLNRKSDAAMRARNANDGFRRYAATSGTGSRHWGQEGASNHIIGSKWGSFRDIAGPFNFGGIR